MPVAYDCVLTTFAAKAETCQRSLDRNLMIHSLLLFCASKATKSAFIQAEPFLTGSGFRGTRPEEAASISV